MNSTASPVLEPIHGNERIQALDILRGFALFGILLTNITRFFDNAPYWTGADLNTSWLIHRFVSWHFFPLFSFLFGVGFAIQLTRAQARHAPFVAVYLRRAAVLLVVGLAFYVLVEEERILYQYALFGGALLLFRNRSPKALLAWAAAFLLFAHYSGPIEHAYNRAVGMAPVAQARTSAEAERAQRNRDTQVQQSEARATGDYGTLVAVRFRMLFLSPPELQLPASSIIFAMFLLGFYAHRRDVFKDVDANSRFFRHALYWAMGVYVSLQYIVPLTIPSWQRLPVWPFRDPALTFVYIAGVVLLLRWKVALRGLTLLGWVGRMGLTNYVLHFVIVTAIFYRYGLGLNWSLRQVMGPVFTLLATLTLVPLSIWWLHRFRFGPLEWAWRSLTYGRRQPMRIDPALRSMTPVPYLRGVVAAIVVLTAGVAGAAWESDATRRSDETEVARLDAEWRSALRTADVAAVGRIADTLFRARGVSGGLTTLPQLRQLMASHAPGVGALTPGRTTVLAHGRTATASGIEMPVDAERGESASARRYVHWYVKQNGRWWLYLSEMARAS